MSENRIPDYKRSGLRNFDLDMYERILQRMCGRVRRSEYTMTEHAHDAAWEDNLTVLDVENAILNGRILERQRDAISREHKYLIRSKKGIGRPIEVIAKFSPSGRLFIITVYSI